ncbi:Terminase, ATPase subunit (GpP) [Escherichia coli]|nr:Terminase, ATPase subunit (GpP) [Escherichia coli]
MALRDDVAQPYQRNQIFLSASRRQAFQFKSIIQKAAAEVDVELKGGDKIILSNGAELPFSWYFCCDGTVLHGQFLFDEFSGSVALLNCARWLALWQPSADCGAPTSPRHPPKRTRHTPTGMATAGTRKRPRINASVFLWTGKRCITGLSALTGRGGKLSRWKMWLITAGNTPILTKFVMKTPKTSSAISICVSLSAKGNRHLT